jgi:hypothetical protein
MTTEEIFQQVMNENCKDPLHRFAELVRQDEREACAKLCERAHSASFSALHCADAIRGRTE